MIINERVLQLVDCTFLRQIKVPTNRCFLVLSNFHSTRSTDLPLPTPCCNFLCRDRFLLYKLNV